MAASTLYFRIKDNGAQVFRISEDTNRARTDLVSIATVVLRSGEIRPNGNTAISDDERSEIAAWITSRRTKQRQRQKQVVEDLADNLGKAAHWVKAQATSDDLAELEERLLWGMYDLRTALVRRKADASQGNED